MTLDERKALRRTLGAAKRFLAAARRKIPECWYEQSRLLAVAETHCMRVQAYIKWEEAYVAQLAKEAREDS